MLDSTEYEVRTLSRTVPSQPYRRRNHYIVDMLAGNGLREALADVDVVAHCAGAAAGDDVIAANLVDAAMAAKRPHIVAISVVGADRVPQSSWLDRKMFGYFGAKHRAEIALRASELPWTILRATQFHQLLIPVVETMTRLPAVPLPAGTSFQPIDAGEVAARFKELILGPPQGLVANLAGPEIHSMRELVSIYLRARRRQRPLIDVRLPGSAAASLRRGVNVDPMHAAGRVTWRQAVEAHLTAETATRPTG
jgi:uncharacterized protein YbjT (DUF2867 family)